jgi:hypothetical protein
VEKIIRVEKEKFEAVLRKMLSSKPVPLAKVPKSKKKLARIVEPITR